MKKTNIIKDFLTKIIKPSDKYIKEWYLFHSIWYKAKSRDDSTSYESLHHTLDEIFELAEEGMKKTYEK